MLDSKVLDTAFQSAINSIIITDFSKPDNPIVYANPAFEKLTGYSGDEVLGENCRFLQGEDTDQNAIDKIREAVRAGRTCEVTLLNYRKDKTPFWNALFVAPLKNADGCTTHFIGIQHDITEQIRAEEEMKRLRRLTQAALDALKGHIAVLDEQGEIVAVNASWRTFAEHKGLTLPNYGIGSNYLDICDSAGKNGAEEGGLVAQAIRDMVANRCQEYSLEYPCHSPDGLHKQWFLVRITQFLSQDVRRLVMSHQDITDRKLAELALQDAYQEMENKVETRTKELQQANTKLLAEIGERLRFEDALGESEARFKAQYRGIPIPTYTWQKQGEDFILIDYNDSAKRSKYSHINLEIGQTAQQVYGEERTDIFEGLALCFSQKDTLRRDVELTAQPSKGKRFLHKTFGFVPPDLVLLHVEDVTEQKVLQEQLLQAKKMEAVGLLAGGVAHDFNNLLTVINGYSNMALKRLASEPAVYGMIDEIGKAGKRATMLTQQLLAFSRKQTYQPEVVDLNASIESFEKMLSRLIPVNINLQILLDENLEKVKTDVGHFEQVLMNLVVNAKDAMPSGGNLTIETHNEMLLQSDVGRADAEPGAYVKVVVKDTGLGMNEETYRHIFDPFFTTKAFGKGTGLGLSTVHEIVKQSGGWVDFESELGKGTTFYVYYPSCEPSKNEYEKLQDPQLEDLGTGNGNILVVEDDVNVNVFMRHALQDFGYSTVLASNAQDAIAAFKRNQGQIDLLIVDLVLPDANGLELARSLKEERNDLKVLYITSYSQDDLYSFGIDTSHVELLTKPFTPLELEHKVYAFFKDD